MNNPSEKVQRRYLDAIDDPSWDGEDPRLEFGVSALPFFVAAFQRENAPSRRARLIRVVGQFRDATALPALVEGLTDDDQEVWKDALDGLVTLGGEQSLRVLRDARAAAAGHRDSSVRFAWIDEAKAQIEEQIRAG